MPNIFYDGLADDETFVPVGDGYVILPKANMGRSHPLTREAVQKCRRRMAGCPSCIQYFEISGEYAAQDADAKAHAQEGHADPDPDLDRRRWLVPEPPDRYREFMQKFNLPKE